MDALAGDISVESIPFSDLNSCANKYILELWQSEWDKFPGNKLHKRFPVLKECIVCPWTNRKEETVIARWPFFYYSFLFIVRSHQCASDVMNFLTIEHVWLTCSDLIEIRESHFTAQSLHVLFQDISLEKSFNFLKEIKKMEKFKLRSLLVVFKYGFKIVRIPVLTHIHFFFLIYDDRMCIALIQPHWLTGCKTPVCLLTYRCVRSTVDKTTETLHCFYFEAAYGDMRSQCAMCAF